MPICHQLRGSIYTEQGKLFTALLQTATAKHALTCKKPFHKTTDVLHETRSSPHEIVVHWPHVPGIFHLRTVLMEATSVFTQRGWWSFQGRGYQPVSSPRNETALSNGDAKINGVFKHGFNNTKVGVFIV